MHEDKCQVSHIAIPANGVNDTLRTQFKETLREAKAEAECVAEQYYRATISDLIHAELAESRAGLFEAELGNARSSGARSLRSPSTYDSSESALFDPILADCVKNFLLHHSDGGELLAESLRKRIEILGNALLTTCYSAVKWLSLESTNLTKTKKNVVAAARRSLEVQFAQSIEQKYRKYDDIEGAIRLLVQEKCSRHSDGHLRTDISNPAVLWPSVSFVLLDPRIKSPGS